MRTLDLSHQWIISLHHSSDLAHTTSPQVTKHLTHFSAQHNSRCKSCAFGHCIPSPTQLWLWPPSNLVILFKL